MAILSNERALTGLLPGLPSDFGIGETSLLSQCRIFLYFLLSVPEPLVDLILLKVQLIREVCDLLSRRRLTFQILIQIPKCIFLAL